MPPGLSALWTLTSSSQTGASALISRLSACKNPQTLFLTVKCPDTCSFTVTGENTQDAFFKFIYLLLQAQIVRILNTKYNKIKWDFYDFVFLNAYVMHLSIWMAFCSFGFVLNHTWIYLLPPKLYLKH